MVLFLQEFGTIIRFQNIAPNNFKILSESVFLGWVSCLKTPHSTKLQWSVRQNLY